MYVGFLKVLDLSTPGQQVINFCLIKIQLLPLGIYLQSMEDAHNVLTALGPHLW